MENYRDYGQIGGIGLTDTPINTVRYGQVYLATHDGVKRLPYMNRSFISFTYGNKHIEDFDLIATITSNRLSRDGYAGFKDNISTYDNLDGQFYWSTHYSNNTITFNLSTDGIDLKKLDNFLFWFSAGVTRELVLSEHPNRAIMARVSKPPALSLLPFESEVDINISGDVYKTSTTLYKGDITLELISDDPHWYAINNILGKKSGNRYIDYWTDANGVEVSIFASKDALKILYEDGIPLGSMIENNMLLGNGAFANVEGNVESLIWSIPENSIAWTDGVPTGEGARIDGILTLDGVWVNNVLKEKGFNLRSLTTLVAEDWRGILSEDNELLFLDKDSDFVPTNLECLPGRYIGKIAGAIVDANGNGILELPAGVGGAGYFFYAGTAPAPTIISFDLLPEFNSSGYLYSINNEFYNPNNPYNSIFIESVKTLELRLTAPSIIASYNKALNILLTEYFSTTSIPDLKEMIIEKVKHPAVRAWVNALLDATGKSSLVIYEDILNRMKSFWLNDEDEYTPFHFVFNSKTGEAFVTYNCRKPINTISLLDIVYEENAINKINTILSEDPNLTDELRYENLVTWGWSNYCISSSTHQNIVPTAGNSATYTQAVKAFCEYVDSKIRNKEEIPTIFKVTGNINRSSLLLHIENEDAGDMLLSNNIFIRERNYPNKNGRFLHWMNTDEGRTYSHRIYHDFPISILNVLILYRNMYL